MIFFCLCHIIIVLMLATLMKSIFWSIFFTVTEQFEERSKVEKEEKELEKKVKSMVEEYDSISSKLDSLHCPLLYCDTTMKRYLFELKTNKSILKSLRQMQGNRPSKKQLKVKDNNMFRNFSFNKTMLNLE